MGCAKNCSTNTDLVIGARDGSGEGVGNSFWAYVGERRPSLLVVVPHPDDDINLAGPLLRGWALAGAEVSCVFHANGDGAEQLAGSRRTTGARRIREALASLAVLGVPRDHVHFLGYGDRLDAPGVAFWRTRRETPLQSPGGHEETYGAPEEGVVDWRFGVGGRHSPYTYAAAADDLRECVLSIQADMIAAIDFDTNPDHRLVSLLVEDALEKILRRPGNTYRPLVLKGFAYLTAFQAPVDFYAPNPLSTARPVENEFTGRVFDGTENPTYRWAERIRFPLPADCVTRTLEGNIQYRALQCHASQMGDAYAERILNGDKVFWLRRTDSLTYGATFTASSGNVGALASFRLWEPEDIRARKCQIRQADGTRWQPDSADQEKCFRCSFAAKRRVAQICFWTEPAEAGNSAKARYVVRFSNGFSVEGADYDATGKANCIGFTPQENVEWIEFAFCDGAGEIPGIAGFEAYEHAVPPGLPIVKICVEDDFAYDWVVPPNVGAVQLRLYRSLSVVGDLRLRIVEGEGCRLNGERLELDASFRCARLRLENEDGTVWDEVTVRRETNRGMRDLARAQRAEGRRQWRRDCRRAPGMVAMRTVATALRRAGLFEKACRIVGFLHGGGSNKR